MTKTVITFTIATIEKEDISVPAHYSEHPLFGLVLALGFRV